jgi:outer membrane protein TolC
MNHFRGWRLLFTACAAMAAVQIPARAGWAKPYRLDELLDMARTGNPGIAAAAQATTGVQAQLEEAQRMKWPSGELTSLLAPMPEIRCSTGDPTLDANGKDYRLNHCWNTGFAFHGEQLFEAITGIRGVLTRTELRLVQPLYTFGKISAGVTAAKEGVEASRGREAGAVADVEQNVRKAYWGAKVARELQSTLKEGLDYLDQAQKKVDQQLAEGSGDASVTDRLRLRTVRAEVEARGLEAQRGASVARSGLRTLIGASAPTDLDIDDAELQALTIPTRTLAQYQEAANNYRPEVQALKHLVATKRALADLEWRRQYPDLALVGTAQYAYSNSVEHPQNAYFNNPYNSAGAGIAAFLRVPLDLGPRNAHAHRLAAEAAEADLKSKEALAGIAFEVEKAFGEMQEASERMKTVQKGEKASRQWIAAMMQNMAVGIAEAKDFSDALLAFFQARVRYLQSIYDFNVAVANLSRATGSDVSAP